MTKELLDLTQIMQDNSHNDLLIAFIFALIIIAIFWIIGKKIELFIKRKIFDFIYNKFLIKFMPGEIVEQHDAKDLEEVQAPIQEEKKEIEKVQEEIQEEEDIFKQSVNPQINPAFNNNDEKEL